jgi:tetratricopeptide (TPR) repeat protein
VGLGLVTLDDESQGRGQAAFDDVRRQLDEDINVLAERFSNSPKSRSYWAKQFMVGGGSSLMQQNRLMAAIDFRLVTILDPDNAEAHNSLAWAMTSVPGETPFEITRAIDSAKKAVALIPKQWMYWNTLGVAAFRAGNWKLAAESLEKSIDLNKPGGAIDFFLLSMTRWHQGKPGEAKQLFDKGATYRQHNPGDMELEQFYREAEGLLINGSTKSKPKTQHNGETAENTGTARN